jgi:hypothetical protein
VLKAILVRLDHRVLQDKQALLVFLGSQQILAQLAGQVLRVQPALLEQQGQLAQLVFKVQQVQRA